MSIEHASVTDRWSAAKRKASEWSAWVEVMFGMILVAELLLPRRNFVMLALYWQTLRMKYMLNVTTGRGYTQVCMRVSEIVRILFVFLNLFPYWWWLHR